MLDGRKWDASEVPGGEFVWPPGDLDLRPRFLYEPADSRRFSRWRVRWSVQGAGVTGDRVRAALEADPDVAEIVALEADDAAARVTVTTVVEPRDGRSATNAGFAEALTPERSAEELERHAEDARRKAGHDGPVSFWHTSVGPSCFGAVLGPDVVGDDAEPWIQAWSRD